jgi:glycosyltransferase involved in cell wall biosynthesis
VDVIYRIAYPYRVHGADARRVLVFLTSENHRFEAGDFSPAPENAGRWRSGEPVFVTPSHWSRAGLLEAGFRDPVVVPHGVDGSVFFPPNEQQRRDLRAGLGVGEDDFMFLNVSAMSTNKGIDLLLLAFARLRQTRRDAVLVLKDQSNLYGTTAASLVDDLARQLPHLLTPDVLGSIRKISSNLDLDELRVLYGAADAYVSPYRAEGFNLPPLEAAACGTPVILTKGGASDDYFDPSFALQVESTRKSSDQLGVYLEPSLDHLADRMEALMLDRAPGLDPAAGRAWVTGRFSWQGAVRQLVDLAGRAA